MSNIFANAQTAKDDGIEEDFVGGGGLLDTDMYPFTVKTAYLGKSQSSEARSVNLLLEVNGKEVRQQVWVTKADGSVTYKDKRTGKDKNLPGFNQINSLALLLLGKELGELDVEERTVKLYDHDAGKEVPKAVDCFVELHGLSGQILLQRQTVDKTAKNAATGAYEPTGETRDQNEIVKFLAAEKPVSISELVEFVKTLGEDYDEIRTQGDPAVIVSKMPEDAGAYARTWLEKNQGQTYVKAKGAGKGGKAFAGSASGGNGEAAKEKKSSLFG